MKTCSACGIEKDIGEFYKQKAGKFGVGGSCKTCKSLATREYRSHGIGKAKQKAYDQQDHVKAKKRVSSNAYSKTEEGDKIRRAYRKSDVGKASTAASVQRDREAHPEKHRARQIAYNARRRGDLIAKPCEECGEEKVHAHHCDYSKPMEVMWLCNDHHSAWHKTNNMC